MSKIEWTEQTWNPFVGCTIVSAGCRNCYAMAQAPRLAGFQQAQYVGTTEPSKRGPVWTGKLNRATESVRKKPLKVRKPTVFFVNSMSDFWHENALPEWQAEALDIMDRTPRHTYQILTKRPENIRPALERIGRKLPTNVWLGCTVESEEFVDRVDDLRGVDAPIRFLSIEPLIGRIGQIDLEGVHWVITGGESGHLKKVRKVEPDWVREVRDQCISAGVAYFHKQWGRPEFNPLAGQCPPDQGLATWIKQVDPHGKGGALVDGILWRQYPEVQGLRHRM